MPKTNRTTPATSASLKTAMQLKDNYPTLEVGLDAVYSGSDICLLVAQFNDGSVRAICNNNDFTDIINLSDPTVSKMWTKNQLASWLISNYAVTDYAESTQGANTTISFNVDGLPYTGTSSNEATALATAILALLAI